MEINTIFTLLWIVVLFVDCMVKMFLCDYVFGLKYWVLWALLSVVCDVFALNLITYKTDFIVPFYTGLELYLFHLLSKKHEQKTS